MLRSLNRHGVSRLHVGYTAPGRCQTKEPLQSSRKTPKVSINFGLRFSTENHGQEQGNDDLSTRTHDQDPYGEKENIILDEDQRRVTWRRLQALEDDRSKPMIRIKTYKGHDLSISGSTLEAHHAVLHALREGQAHALLHACFRASEDPDYLEILPPATFMEILRVIGPAQFLNKYKEIDADLGTYQGSYRIRGTRHLKQVFADYTWVTRSLLSRWLSLRSNFKVAIYAMFLNIASAIGDGQMALAIYNAMHADQIQPDTLCYNFYLEAKCWSNTYAGREGRKLRVIPAHMYQRQTAMIKRSKNFEGHDVGYHGLRYDVIKSFDVMVTSGVNPDVDTFGLLMLAMGREGDMDGVKSVLQRVWDVDVDSLPSEDENVLLFENNMLPGSHLYPNGNLLFTVAHIFGINNELPTALRVVDVISRKYAIEIESRTWAELLTYTFVLSKRRYRDDKVNGASLGHLPLASVENLWMTMVSEPYNIRPTMPMYNRRIRSLWKRQMLDPMLQAMRDAQSIHEAERRQLYNLVGKRRRGDIDKVRKAMDVLEGEVNAESDFDTVPRTRVEPKAFSVLSFEQEELELAEITDHRNFAMISRWVRLLLAGTRWISSGQRKLKWERIGITQAIHEFFYYRPRDGISYSIATGRVQLSPPIEKILLPISDADVFTASTAQFPPSDAHTLTTVTTEKVQPLPSVAHTPSTVTTEKVGSRTYAIGIVPTTVWTVPTKISGVLAGQTAGPRQDNVNMTQSELMSRAWWGASSLAENNVD